MTRKITAALLFLVASSIACASLNPGLFSEEIDLSKNQPSLSTLPIIPTSTVTPTPLPTPTPIPAARLSSGDQARFNGDWERALLEYELALYASNDTEIQSAALLGLGRTHNLAGNYQTAADNLLAFIDRFPQSPYLPHVHFFLAQAYSGLGRHVESAAEYQKYLQTRPGVIDAYVLNLRGDALLAAGDHANAMIDYRAAVQSPSFLDPLDIEIKIANAHAALGDYATAIGIYQDIYQRTSSDYTKALMDLYSGQAYSALGQTEEAFLAYQDAVNNFPTADASYQALLTLVENGVPVDELNRGIVDYYAAQYGVALAAFDRYFQAGAADPATARYYNGLTLRALGNYAGAIGEWDKIILNYPEDRFWDAAWEQKAYTQWWHLRDFNQAIQTLLDFVATTPNHFRAGEFLYDAAVVAERDGQLARAAEIWERVAAEYPGYEKAQRALLLGGIAHFRLGDYAKANALFQRHLANAITLEERAASYLWQGKAQQALGDPVAAKAAWEFAAGVDPTGYYSERARDILRQWEPFSPPESFDLGYDLQAERAQAEEWLKSTFEIPADTNLSTPGPLLSDPRWVRGTELSELGLYEEARTEFEDLRLSLQDDPANSYRLANHLVNLGLYRSAIFAARQVLNNAGMSDADTMSAPAYFNHIRFGTYFADLIIPAAQQYGLHPLLLFSLVRQESAFEGFVRSSAGARGLMQIIPSTGQEVATNLDWPPNYVDEDLYRPMVSIVLGVDYLQKWQEHFHGNLYAALAAYNGGPGNAMEWLELAGNDPDLFLELIRFEETREYIRSIYEIFSIYRRIYNRTP